MSELQDLINELDRNFERQLAHLKRSVSDLGKLAQKLEEEEDRHDGK